MATKSRKTPSPSMSWMVRGRLALAGEAGFQYYVLEGMRLHLGKPLVIFVGDQLLSGTLESLTISANHPDNSYYVPHMRLCIGNDLPQHVAYYINAGMVKILLQEGLEAALPA